MITTKTVLNITMHYFPEEKIESEQIIEKLISDGWNIEERSNFKEIETEYAMHNPDYKGTVILSRSF